MWSKLSTYLYATSSQCSGLEDWERYFSLSAFLNCGGLLDVWPLWFGLFNFLPVDHLLGRLFWRDALLCTSSFERLSSPLAIHQCGKNAHYSLSCSDRGDNCRTKQTTRRLWAPQFPLSHNRRNTSSGGLLVVAGAHIDDDVDSRWGQQAFLSKYLRAMLHSTKLLLLLPRPLYIGGRGIVFDRFLSLFLWFFVSKITRKRLDRCAWSFQRRCGVTMGRPGYIFGQFRETTRCRDAQYWDWVSCTISPQLVISLNNNNNNNNTFRLLDPLIVSSGGGGLRERRPPPSHPSGCASDRRKTMTVKVLV